MQQAKLVLATIESLLSQANLSLPELNAIAYGAGPGSFTGMRIASSVAQGLGFVTNAPIISVSSLAAMAQAAYMEHHQTHFLVALDARMEQIYWAQYKVNDNEQVELIGQEQVYNPEKVILDLSAKSEDQTVWCGIGDGWGKYREPLVKRLGFQPANINPSQIPTAHAVLVLAKSKFDRQEWVKAEEAVPSYLR